MGNIYSEIRFENGYEFEPGYEKNILRAEAARISQVHSKYVSKYRQLPGKGKKKEVSLPSFREASPKDRKICTAFTFTQYPFNLMKKQTMIFLKQ